MHSLLSVDILQSTSDIVQLWIQRVDTEAVEF